jgi:class 3 adenylate cyclase
MRVRKCILDWDGRNWKAVLEYLRNAGRTLEEIERMTEWGHIRAAFATGQKRMVEVCGKAVTATNTIMTFPAATVDDQAGPLNAAMRRSVMAKDVPARTSIDKQLDAFEAKKGELAKIQAQADEIRQKIREGLVDVVVVFIDMVGSANFKLEHKDDPETWILRVRRFDVLVTEYVAAAGGRVVKYIGDEVMAVFDGNAAVDNALSLVSRIETIQKSLSQLTGVPTAIKIAMDKGRVYLLELPGQAEPDPQGTPIDRCARIAKYATASAVLASNDIVKSAPGAYPWVEVGLLPMKGLGDVLVYQLGEKTVTVEERVELPAKQLQELQGQLAKCQAVAEHVKAADQAERRSQVELKALDDLVSSGSAAPKLRLEDELLKASRQLEQRLRRLAEENGLRSRHNSGWAWVAVPGKRVEFSYALVRKDAWQPEARVLHVLELVGTGSHVQASYSLDDEKSITYYNGPTADTARLAEELERRTDQIFSAAVVRLREKLRVALG